MGMLAYDPDRVRRLQGAMTQALDGLRAVSCTDPAAADAVRLVRSTASQLESTWLPLACRVLSTDPLSKAQRRSEHIDALDQSLVKVMAQGYGWSVQHDPLGDSAGVVTAEEARALGARLNEINVEALLEDPEQLRWLATQLQIIGRDPALSAEFLANFHDWADLCDRLGGRRALLLSDTGNGPRTTTRTTIDDLDAVFAGLAHIQRNTLRTMSQTRCLDASSVIPQMDEMNPYSAALIVQYLGLDGSTLAHVADRLLLRWRDMPWQLPYGQPPSDFSFSQGPNAADILLRTLLLDPAACIIFVTLAAEHPDILFGTADDATLAHRVMLAATDPSNVTALQAEALIVPILEYFEHHRYPLDAGNEGYDGSWALFLVDLISPWTMQFSGLNDDWQMAAIRKAELLAFVIDDDGALSRLVANADVVRDGAIATVATGDSHVLEEFAAYFGLLTQLVLNERVQNAEEAEASWRMLLNVAGVVAGTLSGGASVVASGALLGAANWLQPANPERAAADASYAQEYMLTTAAAATVATVVSSWVADGTLPTAFPPPPAPDPQAPDPAMDFERRFLRWIDQLPGGHDGTLADRVVRSKSVFIGAAGAGGALAT